MTNDQSAWAELRSQTGASDFAPAAIDDLITATSDEQAEAAYWRLDNRVVVQGQLFEASVKTAHVLCEAIRLRRVSGAGLPFAMDLLYELAAGESSESEVEAGNPDLGQTCRQMVGRYLDCFQTLTKSSDPRLQLTAIDLLELLDGDKKRLKDTALALSANTLDEEVRRRANEIVDQPHG